MSAAPTDLVVAEPTAPVSTPQFFRGFEGAAVEPFPEAVRLVLAEPVNPRDVEIKPDGIVFLPGVAWRRILTRAFGAGGWALLPRSPARVMGNLVVYHGALVCLGRFVAEAMGECFYREGNANMSYASCIEGARTDALTRCCKDLGYGAEMWDANWREEWKAKYAYQDHNDRTKEGKPKWKLKARVSNPHDLMVGAGGVAPAPAPAASPPPSTSTEAASPGSGDTAEPAGDPAADSGEAASEETLDALTAEIRRRKWTRSYAVTFLRENFSVDTMSALTQQQAARALVLVMARPGGGQ
jgi:hypothetical protein